MVKLKVYIIVCQFFVFCGIYYLGDVVLILFLVPVDKGLLVAPIAKDFPEEAIRLSAS